MPPIVIAAGIAAAGAIGGGAIMSRSAGKSAQRQSEAATEVARIEDEAAKRAEAFQRQQAQQQWVEAEAVRRANYDQWAARQRSLNAFRGKYGYGAAEIPGYAPSQDPGYNTGAPAAGPTGARPRDPDSPIPRDTSDPTRFWPIDPATGLKRPPRPGEDAGPRIVGPDGRVLGGGEPVSRPMGAVDAYLPSRETAFEPYMTRRPPAALSVGDYVTGGYARRRR